MPERSPNLDIARIGGSTTLEPGGFNTLLGAVDDFLPTAYGEMGKVTSGPPVFTANASRKTLLLVYKGGLSYGLGLNTASNMLVHVAGNYLLMFTASFTLSSPSKAIKFSVLIDKFGALATPTSVAFASTSTRPIPVLLSGILDLVAGDSVSIQVQSLSAGNVDLFFYTLSFNLVRL